MSDTLAPSRSKARSYTPAELARRTLHRRAIEAINWGIPAVGSDLMLQPQDQPDSSPGADTHSHAIQILDSTSGAISGRQRYLPEQGEQP